MQFLSSTARRSRKPVLKVEQRGAEVACSKRDTKADHKAAGITAPSFTSCCDNCIHLLEDRTRHSQKAMSGRSRTNPAAPPLEDSNAYQMFNLSN